METTIIMTSLIVLMVILLFIMVSFANKKKDVVKKQEIFNRLGDLELGVQSMEGSVRRDTIVKLDNLLSKAFQYYYNNSNLCGDNLKKAKNIFKRKGYDDLWNVHKIRNNIVHDDYEIDTQEAVRIYNIYKFSIKKILK